MLGGPRMGWYYSRRYDTRRSGIPGGREDRDQVGHQGVSVLIQKDYEDERPSKIILRDSQLKGKSHLKVI